MGDAVGYIVSPTIVGCRVGAVVGAVGAIEGSVGTCVGTVGILVGEVGETVGWDGAPVGVVGEALGYCVSPSSVGWCVGDLDGAGEGAGDVCVAVIGADVGGVG